LASSPDADSNFKIAGEIVPGGKAHLPDWNVKEGQSLGRLRSRAFSFAREYENQKISFFAGGSGITPVISMIQIDS